MENSSSNKNICSFPSLEGLGLGKKCSKSPKGLLLHLLFICLCISSQAQTYFNKTYSLFASASSFQAVAPLGNDGAFMAMALVADSATRQQAIKIVRYNNMGEAQAEKIILHPEHPYKRIFGNVKCLTRVHDNLYAVVGTRYVAGAQKGAFLMTIDSNASLLQIRDIFLPAAGIPDTFTYMSAVRYDGWGHLLVSGHVQGSGYRGDMLLQNTIPV